MSLPLLMSKIIDIATAHANSLGIGNPAMESLGCGWVLSRVAIEMNRWPMVNETYSISTWVESWNRHFSVRNFCVTNAQGEPLGYASSVWMVLNMQTRENAGLAHLSLSPELITGETCPIARQGKHMTIVDMDRVGEVPRGAISATSQPIEHTFRYTDLDFYRHVNTVRYLSLLLNQFTLEEMDKTAVKRIELAFMREAHYGEPVSLLRADDGLTTAFSIVDAADQTPLLFSTITRMPRE